MTNGDLTIPQEVVAYFRKKGSSKTTVTPAALQRMINSTRIPLPQHDIYVMGKMKGSLEPCFFTRIRIVNKASERNTLQGLLGVRFIAGHGLRKMGGDTSMQIMRPAGIQKYVTDDTSNFKKRAVVHLGDEVLCLKDAEGFCDIPLMDDRTRARVEKVINAKKREAYARKKKGLEEWPHMNRKTMLADNQKTIHRMLLPYMKNLPTNQYFHHFARDMWAGLLQLRQEFCPDQGGFILEVFPDLCKKRSRDDGDQSNRNEPSVKEEQQEPSTKRRALNKLSKNASTLRSICSSDVSW